MKRFLCALGAALLSSSLLAAPFADPRDTPAKLSTLAARALVNGLAQAGPRLVAVGQRGHVLLSDDGGASWRQAAVPVSADLLAVHFATPRLGWASGHDGVILFSEDGGQNWQRQFDGRRDPQLADKPLTGIWFDDARRGMAVGAFGMAYCTEDGGARWQDCQGLLDNPGALHLHAIARVGTALWIVGEQGQVWRKSDGAARFQSVASGYKGSLFGLVGDGSQVIAYGLRGSALRSRDGGASWDTLATGTRSGLTAGAVLAGGGFALLSQTGQILLSSDGQAFAPLAGAAPGPVSTALASGGRLIIGGARGLRTQALP